MPRTPKKPPKRTPKPKEVELVSVRDLPALKRAEAIQKLKKKPYYPTTEEYYPQDDNVSDLRLTDKLKKLDDIVDVVQSSIGPRSGSEVFEIEFIGSKKVKGGVQIVYHGEAGGAHFAIEMVGKLNPDERYDFTLEIDGCPRPVLYHGDIQYALQLRINNIIEKFYEHFHRYHTERLGEEWGDKPAPWGKVYFPGED